MHDAVCLRPDIIIIVSLLPFQNCFEIFKVDGVIKAWKKDSDGKPVPGMFFTHTILSHQHDNYKNFTNLEKHPTLAKTVLCVCVCL